MLSFKQRQNIQQKAEDLIRRSGQESVFPISLTTVLKKEKLTLKTFIPPEGSDLKNYSGFIDKDKKLIYVNDEEPFYRKRFTIAHEIGHYVLEHGNRIDYRNHKYSNEPEELEADLFAASLLMPKSAFMEVYRTLGLSELAAFFAVSRKAIGIRADELFSEAVSL